MAFHSAHLYLAIFVGLSVCVDVCCLYVRVCLCVCVCVSVTFV